MVVSSKAGAYIFQAVDSEGEILDVLVQRHRDKAAAPKLMRKLLKKQDFAPAVLVRDNLASYGATRMKHWTCFGKLESSQ